MKRSKFAFMVATFLFAASAGRSVRAADETLAAWPEFPEANATLEIPAQEWPQQAGARTVKIGVFFPGGKLANVTAETGIMLTLHNWGGSGSSGTANPNTLAERLNVVAITVDYLQSGRKASVEDPEPYDFGYLQGLDALRALWFVFDGLKSRDIAFAEGRLFATGGSGGGNVTLMANKLAPRTFACIVDMCGMSELTDDMAYNEPGGTRLNARWSRDPKSPNYLSPADQEIRHVGNPSHLELMKQWGNTTRIAVIHGVDDASCPVDDARRMVRNMQAVKLDVRPVFIDKAMVDGKVFTSTAHGFGNRTESVFKIAGEWLKPGGEQAVVRTTPTDFERKDTVICYPVTGGEFTISYENGFPVGKFSAAK